MVERFEDLERQKADLSDDFKELAKEAKGDGWNVKAIRKVVKWRAMDPQQQAAAAALDEEVQIYLDTLEPS